MTKSSYRAEQKRISSPKDRELVRALINSEEDRIDINPISGQTLSEELAACRTGISYFYTKNKK